MTATGRDVPTGESDTRVLADALRSLRAEVADLRGTLLARAGGSGPSSSCLACVQYSGGSGNYSTSSTALVAADTTNLRASIVAPSSGDVWATLEGALDTATSVVGYVFFGVLHGATNLGNVPVIYDHGENGTGYQPQPARGLKITGLTPGASYDLDFAWRVASGTMTARLYKGANARPTITVWELP